MRFFIFDCLMLFTGIAIGWFMAAISSLEPGAYMHLVCESCRKKDHLSCPGGTWCDCQHKTPTPEQIVV